MYIWEGMLGGWGSGWDFGGGVHIFSVFTLYWFLLELVTFNLAVNSFFLIMQGSMYFYTIKGK